MPAPPDALRIGVAGLGNRGSRHLDLCAAMDDEPIYGRAVELLGIIVGVHRFSLGRIESLGRPRFTGPPAGDDNPYVTPSVRPIPFARERVAMGVETLADELAALVEGGTATAAQVTLVHDGDALLERSFGTRSPEADAPPVTDASPFLVASITKPVTATAVMQCAERGLIDVDDPVSEYVPAFTGDGREDVTIRHLLTHTSGLPDMLPENEALRRRNASPEEFVERVIETPLRFEPGSRVEYQSMGIDLAAEITERVTGTRLRERLERDLFEPLDMDETFLGLDGYEPSALVQCDVPEEPGDPDHDRWDWNSAYWRDFGAPWGGLHSTAGDLATFLEAFLNGGERDGARILEADTARAMTSLQTEGLDEPWGLGWALRGSRSYFGDAVSSSAFGHGGATGTVAWADPERRAAFVCLTTLPLAEHPDGFLGGLSDAAVRALDAR